MEELQITNYDIALYAIERITKEEFQKLLPIINQRFASESAGSVSCEAHRPDIEILTEAVNKCKEIDAEEIKKIFYSTYPTDFLDGFISALEEKIKELSVR